MLSSAVASIVTGVVLLGLGIVAEFVIHENGFSLSDLKSNHSELFVFPDISSI